MGQSVFPVPSSATTPIVGAGELVASGQTQSKHFYKSPTLTAGDYLVYVEGDGGLNVSDNDWVSISAYKSNIWRFYEETSSSKPIRFRLTENESIVIGVDSKKYGAQWNQGQDRLARLNHASYAPNIGYNLRIRNTDEIFWLSQSSNTIQGDWFNVANSGITYAKADSNSTHTAPWTTNGSRIAGRENNIYYGAAGNFISFTTDKINWTNTTTAATTSGGITDIAYGNGVYVLTTTDGNINSSTDFNTWTLRTSGWEAQQALRSVRFQNGKFVAVGDGGAICTSTNGTTWTKITTLLGSTDVRFTAVDGIGDTWVAYSSVTSIDTESINSVAPVGGRSFDNGATWELFKLHHTYGASLNPNTISTFSIGLAGTANQDWGKNRVFVYDGYFYIQTSHDEVTWVSSDGINWNPIYGLPIQNWTPIITSTKGLIFSLMLSNSSGDKIRGIRGKNRKVLIYKANI